MAANIVQDKERITVNNNYSNYSYKPVPQKLHPTESATKNKPGFKSLFGFKNKKFMEHHEEIERIKSTANVHLDEIEEHESNAVQLPADILEEINKLGAMLEKVDFELINKLAQEFKQKGYVQETGNKLE